MKKVAKKMHVPLIDLHRDSMAYLNTLTEAQGLALGPTRRRGRQDCPGQRRM